MRRPLLLLAALCVFGTAVAAWAFVPKVLTGMGAPPAPPPIITAPPPQNFTGPAGACKTGGTGQVIVTTTITCQTIDGFGVYAGHSSTWQHALWGTGSGQLGYSIMRYAVPYFGTSNPCSVVQRSCVTGGNADITLAQNTMAAAGSDLKTLWTVWNYPSALGSTGDCPVDPAAAAGGATFLANFLDSLRIYYSIVPNALSVQNEPDNFWSCSQTLMPAAQMHSLIVNNIGPTFISRGIHVPLMMPETFQTTDLGSWLSPTMNDSTAAGYVTYEASHQYDGDPAVQPSNPFISNGKHLWETETSGLSGSGPSLCGGCWDPSIADGMMWAGIMDRWLAGTNASAWLYWVSDGCGNPPGDNECLVSDDMVTASKRAYIIGNYSKFVRPGWVMIAATHDPQSNVTVTAYKNPVTNDYAIVAQNAGSSAVSQSFAASGGAVIASATPWITSSSLNLAQQPPVTLSGGSFSYSLPGTSVTTFVGQIVPGSGGTIACDIGPNYVGTVPPAAAAAGFNHCIANYDFTTSAFSSVSSWLTEQLGQCTATGPFTLYTYDTNGGCGDFAMVNDTANGGPSQVLRATYLATDTNGATTLATLGNRGTHPGLVKYMGYYADEVLKLDPNFTNGGSCASTESFCLYFDWWQYVINGVGDAALEVDFVEAWSVTPGQGNSYWSGGAGGGVGWGNWGNNTTPDLRTYNTFGGLLTVTNGGSPNLMACSVVNNAHINNCGSYTDSNANINQIDFRIATIGPQFNSNHRQQDQHVYIKRATIWGCTGYASGPCYTGSLVSY